MTDAQALLQRKALLERKRELLLRKQQIQPQVQEDTGPGLAFKRPSIPFRSPAEGMGISDPRFALQNLGALAQREEAALSGAGEELISGRFQNIPKEFMRGLKGEQTTEFGDLGRRRGLGEDASQAVGFGASMLTPINVLLTILTGGTNKLITPSLAKNPVGKQIGKIPGGVRNFLGGIEGSTIKDLRNIGDRLGVSRLFRSGIEREEFVGRELTPKAMQAIGKNVENLDPTALREIGLPHELISELKTSKTPRNTPLGDRIRKTVQSKIDQAGAMYQSAKRSLPQGFKFDVRGLRGKVGGILREHGVIDDSGKLIRPIVDDPQQVKGLYRLWNELSDRVRLNKPSRVAGLLGEEDIKPLQELTGKESLIRPAQSPKLTERGIKGGGKVSAPFESQFATGELTKDAENKLLEALSKADELDSDQFFRNRLNLQGLLSGEKKFDRLIMQVIDVMDDAAEASGQKSLKDAVKTYRGAKEFEESYLKYAGRADDKVEKLTSAKGVQTDIFQSQPKKNVAQRDELKNLIGGLLGDDVIDLSQANKILTSSGPEGIGKIPDRGFIATGRNIARRGIRTYEEKVRPPVSKAFRSTTKLRDLLRRPLSLAERKAITKATQGEE